LKKKKRKNDGYANGGDSIGHSFTSLTYDKEIQCSP